MKKFKKLIKHLVKGTIGRRLEFEKVKKTALSRSNKWNDFKLSSDEFIQQSIFEDLTLNLYKDSGLSENLFRGDFEYQEIQFLRSFLREGDAFIDIGANIGYFSIVASKQVGVTGEVHAFEPTNTTYTRLQDSLKLNSCKNITLHKIALSDKKEEREFVTSNDGFDAYNSLGNPSKGSDFTRTVITTMPFDDYNRETIQCTPTLIKIDVEGWEIPVLNGMKETLLKDSAPTLLVEFTEDNAVLSGFSCNSLFDLISSFGYDLYEYNWVRNELVKQENKDYFNYTNLVCIKRHQKDAFSRLKNVDVL